MLIIFVTYRLCMIIYKHSLSMIGNNWGFGQIVGFLLHKWLIRRRLMMIIVVILSMLVITRIIVVVINISKWYSGYVQRLELVQYRSLCIIILWEIRRDVCIVGWFVLLMVIIVMKRVLLNSSVILIGSADLFWYI